MTRVYLSVATLSAAALMLEGTYTRLLAVAQFYHFAFLVVSLALLGFGASGSLLSIFPSCYEMKGEQDGVGKLRFLLALSGLGFTLSIGLSYGIINWLPFDSYSIAWDSIQILYFGLYYLGLTLPFLFAGVGIGAALSSSSSKSNQVYAVNLFGSAGGILLALVVMQLAGVPGALLTCGILGLFVIPVSGWQVPKLGNILVWGLGLLGIVGLIRLSIANIQHDAPIGVSVSPYKSLSYALRIPGVTEEFSAWNAVSRLDVVAGASTRVMPGLSYTYTGNPPPQLGMALDADSLQPITLITPEDFTAADFLPESISFQLIPGADVLVLESGAGLGILQALAGGANHVTAVEDNPLLLEAVSSSAADFDVYALNNVKIHFEASRVILRSLEDRFDIVYLPLNDPYRPVASGAYSLSENYSLTVEALEGMIDRLSPDGLLVLTRWLQTPSNESLRIFASLIEALEERGLDNPESKIIAHRGIQTMTFLVKPDGWKAEELVRTKNFLEKMRFDLVWAPDIEPGEVNRFNKLPEPEYFNRFKDFSVLKNRAKFYREYPFSIQPARDDRPFFFHFFKWQQTPEIFATIGRVWQPFGGSGYFVLIALLLLVILMSTLFIVMPLLIKSARFASNADKEQRKIATPTWRVFVFFGSIGIAFMFLEIPIIQKSILSMGHPILAFSLVVLTLLIFSGFGSLLARRYWQASRKILVLLFVLSIFVPFWLSLVQDWSLGLPLIPRSLILAISLAPLGFLMGFPFPIGLKWLEISVPHLVPWAWAVNGCASVVAAVLAAILVLSTSFSVVLVIGALFYGVASLTLKT